MEENNKMLFYFVQITYNFNYKTIKFTILVAILFYLHFDFPLPRSFHNATKFTFLEFPLFPPFPMERWIKILRPNKITQFIHPSYFEFACL